MIPIALTTAVLDSAVVVTRAQPAWLWTVEGMIAVTMGVLLLGLLGALAFMFWKLAAAFEKLGDAVERIRADLKPVTDSAASITGHLEKAAESVHYAVDEVSDTIHTANAALRDAVATADARFHELDAIVQVARDEAEDVVVGAASVMRGVRGGVSALRHRDRSPSVFEDDPEADPAPPPRRSGGPRVRRGRARD
jgi:methyl-accepting chemotaxis protein